MKNLSFPLSLKTVLAPALAFVFLATPALVTAEGTKKNAPGTRDKSGVVADSVRTIDSSATKNRNPSNTGSQSGTARDRTMPRDTIADTNLVPARPGY